MPLCCIIPLIRINWTLQGHLARASTFYKTPLAIFKVPSIFVTLPFILVYFPYYLVFCLPSNLWSKSDSKLENCEHKLLCRIDLTFTVGSFESQRCVLQKMRARRGLQTTSSFYRWGTEAQEEEVTCQVGGRAKTGFRLMQLIVKPTNIHVHIQGMDVGAAGRREDKLQPGPDCQ